MKEEIIGIGKTVEDAINNACRKLGCEREDCEWEIIDLPKKGFLGLKNIPAKVRVSAEMPDKIPAPAPVQPSSPPKETRVPVQNREANQPQAQPQRREPVKERPARSRDEQPSVDYSVTPPSEETKRKAEVAARYLEDILRAMDLPDASVQISWEEGSVRLAVVGDGLGAIIGRRGETLDSLQYLCGLVANRLGGDYLRVTVDCGDYRLKRKATLEALAHKLSEQVLRTDSSKILEPMNPFERRIIHATVSTIEGVSSTSVGEEPNRRVVITSPTAKARSGRPGSGPVRRGPAPRTGEFRGSREGGDRDRRGGGGRPGGRDNDRRGGRPGGRDSRDRGSRVSNEVRPSAPPANPPKEAEDKPLYGKIDLD